ncbi:MAG TPA: hypothetical protein VMW47_10800 [Verrucomicrobiae bacterium]|nr:hypothetical protein [Verrucomicrobiae bacterium]
MLDLWQPHAGLALAGVLLTAYLLGVVHGITPDEHTWPITFSYAIGSYSSRRGLLVGLLFSGAFTLQRAIASELAALALIPALTHGWEGYVVYIVVGAAMALAGAYMLRTGRLLHLELPRLRNHLVVGHERATDAADLPRAPRPWMALVHGFVAGWGFGAFALILFTVLVPAMHSIAFGWVPGALFGLGTTTVQAAVGASFGWVSRRLRLSPDAAVRVGRLTSGRTLLWGGLLFAGAGGFGLVLPGVAGLSLATGLHVHNLDQIGLPIILVMVIVLGIGLGTLVHEVRAARVPTDSGGAVRPRAQPRA